MKQALSPDSSGKPIEQTESESSWIVRLLQELLGSKSTPDNDGNELVCALANEVTTYWNTSITTSRDYPSEVQILFPEHLFSDFKKC